MSYKNKLFVFEFFFFLIFFLTIFFTKDQLLEFLELCKHDYYWTEIIPSNHNYWYYVGILKTIQLCANYFWLEHLIYC